MSQLANGVEVLVYSQDPLDYLEFPADATESYVAGHFLYYDTSAKTVKKYVPADSTAAVTNQNKIVGFSSNGKALGETRAVICKKAEVLMDATAPTVGADMVMRYIPSTGKFVAYTGSLYNTDIDPDITLANSFATALDGVVEADGRARIAINGDARIAAVTT